MNDLAKAIVVLICALSALGASLGLHPLVTYTSSRVISIPASEDAIANQYLPTQNYGSNSYLQIAHGSGRLRYGWMKFDISGVPAQAVVESAWVSTYIEYVSSTFDLSTGNPAGPGSAYYEVGLGDNAWAESTITWNNQPYTSPGAWESALFGKDAYGTGWFDWTVGNTQIQEHLTTDKKISYVLRPDFDHLLTNYGHYINVRSREYGGGFTPVLRVQYKVPLYTLTVKVEDSAGTPLVANVFVYKGASLVASGQTGTSGEWVMDLEATTYSVTVDVSGVTKSQTVELTSAQTSKFTYPSPSKTFTVTFNVKDQVGNPLPATLKVDTQTVTCNTQGVGKATITSAPGQTTASATATASVNVGNQKYETTTSFTVDRDSTEPLTITRRFLWKFFINYTDGSMAKGTLTATSYKESLDIPIVSGYGEGYLLDGTYQLSFSASPAVNVGTVKVDTDKEAYITLSTATKQATAPPTETTPSEPTLSPTAPPSPVLLPSTHVYLLTAAIIAIGIIAIIVRARRKP